MLLRPAMLPALFFAGFFGHHFQLQFLGVPQNRQNTACSHRGIGQQAMQVVHARDRLAVHRDDYVAFAQSCSSAPGYRSCTEATITPLSLGRS